MSDVEVLAAEAAAAGISICGVQEARQRGTGRKVLGSMIPEAQGWEWVYSGHATRQEWGVGALLSPAAARALRAHQAISERIMTLVFDGPIITTVVVAYAPTNTVANRAASTAFYAQLSEVLGTIREHHMVVVLGDLNAKVGTDASSWPGIIGQFGTPSTLYPPWQDPRHPEQQPPPGRSRRGPNQAPAPANANGKRCLELCAHHQLVVANTLFQHSDVHTASFYNEGKKYWATQDLVLVSQRFKSSMRDCRVLPDAISHRSDHKPVICDLQLRLRAVQRRPAGPPRPNLARLEDAGVKAALADAVRQALGPQPIPATDINAAHTHLCERLLSVAQEVLGPMPRTHRQQVLSAGTLAAIAAKQAAFRQWQAAKQALRPAAPTSPLGVVHQVAALAARAEAEQTAKAAYRLHNAAARAGVKADKHTLFHQQVTLMEAEMRANRTGKAYKMLAALLGDPPSHRVDSITRPDGSTATGDEVAQALATHFCATLNVHATVPEAVLQQVPCEPQAHPQTAVAMAACAPRLPASPPPPPPRHSTRAAAAARAAAAGAAATMAAAETEWRAAAARAANGDAPSLAEVQAAIAAVHATAPGLDGVSASLLKAGGPTLAVHVHAELCKVWEDGQAPVAFKQAALVPLHKKGSHADPDNYRGVTLLCVCGKVYVTVIHERIRRHLNGQLLDSQHGFRPGRGTGDALFGLNRLAELARDFDTPLHAAFVDFRKAFDSVHRPLLWRLLLARGVAPKLVALIEDLYSGFQAQVVANGHTSLPFPMSTGVRQGCPMSPTLFNVFMDFLMRSVAAQCGQQGVQGFRFAFRVGSNLVPVPSTMDSRTAMLMLAYADDLVLLAGSSAQLHTAMQILEATARTWGMQLNYGKTKCMVFAGAGAQPAEPEGGRPIQAPEQSVMQLQHGAVATVSDFVYLGSTVQPQAQHDKELDRRLHAAGRLFGRLRKRVLRAGISLGTKMRFYKTMVVPTLLYGASESWALTQAQLRRLNAFNATCLRRILGVRRAPGMMRNAELYAITKQPSISALLSEHRLRWLGHVARKHTSEATRQLLHASSPFTTEGQVLDRAMGQPAVSWNRMAVASVQEAGMTQDTWLSMCQNRDEWRVICASVAAT